MSLADFREVYLVDFEFSAPPGDSPVPICLVAKELHSGHDIRVWEDELHCLPHPPYPTGPETLLVAFYASAEIGCHLSLGWPVPSRVLDLFVEFRNMTNGEDTPCGNTLLGALAWFGFDGIDAAEKTHMRELAQRGGPWTADERRAQLDYCGTDVDALARLLPKMLPRIDLPRALLRGRYMVAAARMEAVGIPLDSETHATLVAQWSHIRGHVVDRVDQRYHVYEGGSFRAARWEAWLNAHDVPWPRLPSGALALDDETFREMARAYPEVAPIHELRVTVSQLRRAKLTVGADNRNRCLLSAFRARTGRNQPSTSRFIFGLAAWLRSLVRPERGAGLAYVDWSQQEFGIAAALSGDARMLDAYESGDPYLTFAKQAAAAPADATKTTHRSVREQFKACALAVQYGMGEVTLAQRIGQPVSHARQLLRLHHDIYRTFWKWSDAAVDCAQLEGHLLTTFGWTLHVGRNVNSRSLRNFPMQANGAEMLRLACCLVTERGIRVCAPVHDAILVEAPLDRLDETVEVVQSLMAEASQIVLAGVTLRSDAYTIRYPDRYVDVRGQYMWRTVMEILDELSPTEVCASAT